MTINNHLNKFCKLYKPKYSKQHNLMIYLIKVIKLVVIFFSTTLYYQTMILQIIQIQNLTTSKLMTINLSQIKQIQVKLRRKQIKWLLTIILRVVIKKIKMIIKTLKHTSIKI